MEKSVPAMKVIKVPTSQTIYVLERLVGSGQFGSVYDGYQEGFPQQRYAIKMISKIAPYTQRKIEEKVFIREVMMM